MVEAILFKEDTQHHSYLIYKKDVDIFKCNNEVIIRYKKPNGHFINLPVEVVPPIWINEALQNS